MPQILSAGRGTPPAGRDSVISGHWRWVMGVAGEGEVAIANLYDECYRRLVTQLYAFTSDLAEAQDAVQEAFARALARPRHVADIDNPEAWLRTVAVNLVRRRWRRRRVLDAILMRTRPVTTTIA